MGYIVVHPGKMSEIDYRNYLLVVSRMLLRAGVGTHAVDRLPMPGQPNRWWYVSKEEGEARELMEEVRSYTEDPGWELRAVMEAPALGPLCPLTVELGKGWKKIGFGLDSITEWALELAGNRPVPHRTIWVEEDSTETNYSAEDLRRLARQFLPILTNLNVEQLAPFGGFEIVDPVAQRAVVPFTPFHRPNGEIATAEPPTHCDTVASPARYTAPSLG